MVTGIEQGRLRARLLFFDEVIVSSIRMRELPFFIKMFGIAGFEELLERGLLRLSSDTATVGTDFKKNEIRDLPLLQFSQFIVDAHDRSQVISDGLQCLLQVSGSEQSEAILTF